MCLCVVGVGVPFYDASYALEMDECLSYVSLYMAFQIE